jgi:hypothetical protein
MIRDIIAGDKPQVLRLVEMFFKERLERVGTFYSPEHASLHFDMFLNTPGVLALCYEKEGRIIGLIAGIASAIIFSNSIAMQEMVWYVDPEHRTCGLRLLKEFEKRSTEKGLKFMGESEISRVIHNMKEELDKDIHQFLDEANF